MPIVSTVSPGRRHRPWAEAVVDLAAVRANVTRLRAAVGETTAVMAVVKADGYGHGMLACARAAREAGAAWLGVAHVEEALQLREAGDTGRLMAWLLTPGERLIEVVDAGVDLSVSAPWGLDEVVEAARAVGTTARVHLKADSGLGRNGAAPADWPDLVTAALKAQAAGHVQVVGLWSHLACADDPDHPATTRQIQLFAELVAHAERAGVVPEVRHLANSAATLIRPDSHLDLVRVGVAVYGLAPSPALGTSTSLGLRPAMTLRARLALVKRVPAGHGVSYGHRYVTDQPTTLGLVPLGYADGVPRAASNAGPVLVAGRRTRVAGTVAMDQFVVDLGDTDAAPGDEVVLFGPGDDGEPTAVDWAEAAGSIGYEIVTRIGARVPRAYVNDTDVSEQR